jgi:hypothetical protein
MGAVVREMLNTLDQIRKEDWIGREAEDATPPRRSGPEVASCRTGVFLGALPRLLLARTLLHSIWFTGTSRLRNG